MPVDRKEVVEDGQAGVCHCVSRCVRRSFCAGMIR
jgi:hypothetical protein